MRKIPTVQKLRNNTKSLGKLIKERILISNNMDILDTGKDPHLIQTISKLLLTEAHNPHLLHRIVEPVFLSVHLVDDREGAFAQLALQGVLVHMILFLIFWDQRIGIQQGLRNYIGLQRGFEADNFMLWSSFWIFQITLPRHFISQFRWWIFQSISWDFLSLFYRVSVSMYFYNVWGMYSEPSVIAVPTIFFVLFSFIIFQYFQLCSSTSFFVFLRKQLLSNIVLPSRSLPQLPPLEPCIFCQVLLRLTLIKVFLCIFLKWSDTRQPQNSGTKLSSQTGSLTANFQCSLWMGTCLLLGRLMDRILYLPFWVIFRVLWMWWGEVGCLLFMIVNNYTNQFKLTFRGLYAQNSYRQRCNCLQTSIIIVQQIQNYWKKQKGMDKTFETLMTKHVPKSNEVEGNPWDVIPIKNVKQAKNTTEVHLGQRKITKLVNFVDFPNLEVLWVNKNSLESFEGLQRNFRLKHIFAQENKLKTINKIFEKLKHIETLVLYDNELRDLQKLIKCLRQLKNLKHLDLFNNPASHEPNYKFRVIHALPTLQILDRHKISLHQRMEAQKFISNKGRKAQKPFNLNV